MGEGAFGRSDAEIDLLVRGKRSGIAVVGFDDIGTVIGAVLADRGWPVTGIDVRQTVVDEINLGKTTVPEPRLNELVANNVGVGRLRATTDFGVIADNNFVIVTVGTPASCTWPRCPDLCGRRLLACPMSDHPDAKLAYFPRWAGCVARGNLPMGMWRDCSTPCAARLTAGLRAVTHKLTCRNT
jgi:UDP-glucose/GDP-mannose dehydrogenase family, NAD binding domain